MKLLIRNVQLEGRATDVLWCPRAPGILPSRGDTEYCLLASSSFASKAKRAWCRASWFNLNKILSARENQRMSMRIDRGLEFL